MLESTDNLNEVLVALTCLAAQVLRIKLNLKLVFLGNLSLAFVARFSCIGRGLWQPATNASEAAQQYQLRFQFKSLISSPSKSLHSEITQINSMCNIHNESEFFARFFYYDY